MEIISSLTTRARLAIIGSSIIIPWFGLWLHRKVNLLEHTKRANYYQRKPVPNAQGVWLWLLLVALIAISGWQYIANHYMVIYLGAITILAIIATIDLFRPISSWMRLILQIALFGSIIIYGDIGITEIRIGNNTDLTIASRIGIVGSIVRFGLCTNAINRFDGIGAQSSGVTAIGSASLFAVVSTIVIPSYENLSPVILQQLEITQIIALSLTIVAIIYTIIEYKPLGLIRDIGTSVYGFSLAYLALLGGAKVGILVVTLSLVIFDAIRVTLNRVIAKKNPFKGDYTHFHHRLITNGRTRSEVRRFAWIWSATMAILMILQGTHSLHKRIIMIMMALLFFGVNIYLFWIKKLPTEMKVNFKTEEVVKLE